jgi:hypothetical protein
VLAQILRSKFLYCDDGRPRETNEMTILWKALEEHFSVLIVIRLFLGKQGLSKIFSNIEVLKC